MKNQKQFQFHADIITSVPTSCLIEDYRTLAEAMQKGDWDLVTVAKECLAESIDSFTKVPEGLNITPSVSSMIDMGQATGIMLIDGKDPLCRAGKPISNAMLGGVEQCDANCPYKTEGCCPEDLTFLMADGSIYENDEGM